MTCIIGYSKNDTIYMGGDSAAVNSYHEIDIRQDRKVFIKRDMIFGFSASYRVGQILKYDFKIPDHNHNLTNDEYLHSVLIPKMIGTLKEKGKTIKNGEISDLSILIGYKGFLYEIQEDFQISQLQIPFCACGAGANFAKGAFYVLENNKKLSAKNKILKSLETSSYFSAAVSPPFYVLKLKSK